MFRVGFLSRFQDSGNFYKSLDLIIQTAVFARNVKPANGKVLVGAGLCVRVYVCNYSIYREMVMHGHSFNFKKLTRTHEPKHCRYT
jgi:hypothetical protein